MIHNHTEYIVNNNDDNNTFMNLLNLLFTIMWSSLTGATIGFAIVSYIFDYNNENNQVVEEENEGEEEEENENDKYYQELSDLQERILSTEELENLRLNVIEEEMSNGKVIMTYNSDNETFWYYTDYKSVPYAVLDKIARLFAITYNCKSVCVNSKEELEKAEKKYEEKMVRQEEQQRLNEEKLKETVSEINNEYFEIEHSLDGIDFEMIGSVQGNGTTNLYHQYRFVHLNPSNGNNYY